FFFQAEDGIRDKLVTGVQTCALPISSAAPDTTELEGPLTAASAIPRVSSGKISSSGSCTASIFPAGCCCISLPRAATNPSASLRSEERRVGKECRSRRSAYHVRKESV